MKALLKIILLLTFTGSLLFSQVVISEPEAPSILSWGGDKLTEKQEQEYLNKIDNAQLKKELLQIKKLDEKRYFSLLRKSSFMSFPSLYSVGGTGVSILSDNNNEDNLRRKITELEIYSEAIGIKYQHADQSDKQKLASQLKDTLGEVFDLRETQRKEEVENLEKKLAELKESIQIRSNNKQQIVDERFRTLTGKSKYLKWD